MNTVNLRRVSLALALGVLAAGTARADTVLVDQSPPSPDNAFFSDLVFPQEVADNFTLSAAASPDSMTFWGSYFPVDAPLNPDLFSLAFYNDSAGAPGSLITSFGITATRTDIGPSNYGVDIYEYTTSFAPVNLAAGTYWVSVVNDSAASTAPGNVWAWSISAGIYDSTFAFSTEQSRTPTSWIIQGGSDMAFTLSAVPEPSSLALAGLGGLALLVGRKRRRRD